MYITRNKLSEWRIAAGLEPGDELLAAKIPALLVAIDGPPFDGLVDETDAAQRQALANLVVVSVADLAKVAALAVAAGQLVKL